MAIEYRDQGVEAQRNGSLDTALSYYQKAAELDPSFALAYNDMGVIYEAKGWSDKAEQAYRRAIDLDPTLPAPYYNLGILFEKRGDLKESVKFLKQRVMLGSWDDPWTEKARSELRGLGVSDPEIQADFLDQHLARLETAKITGEPRGNDLNPKGRKRQAQLHLYRAKQLYYMGLYHEALMELGQGEILNPKSKEIQEMLEVVQKKAFFN